MKMDVSNEAWRVGKNVVAVAMSGGVDSSVAAAVLKENGYEVIGITALITGSDTVKQSRFCSDSTIQITKQVADQLEIPIYVVDVHEEFESQIIEYFISEYISGRTPSPCGLCNSRIKFGLLMEKALCLGAGCLATGHYARIREDEKKRCHLLRGIDQDKDQSYFLFNLTQEQLAKTIFPLGGTTKKEVLVYAQEQKLASRESKGSQELCFVSAEHYGTWIEARRPDIRGTGDIVDTQGRKLGEHRGIYHYTIGQREGLGIAVGYPVYVVALDAKQNIVVVGDRSETLKKCMIVKDVDWITGGMPSRVFRALTRIRYNHKPAASFIRLSEGSSGLNDGVVEVEFEEAQFAITPGQIAAFYIGSELIGGGWIS